MAIGRHITVLLIGFLMSWGGLGGYGAHMAMAAHSSAGASVAIHHADSHVQAQYAHASHKIVQEQDKEQSGALNCCLFTCGMATVLPTPDPGYNRVGWEVLRMRVLADDRMAGRSVSPLLRPPRLAL